MAKYVIKWTETARNDLEEIIDYLAIEDEKRALVVLDKLQDKVKTLYTLPNRGRYIPELESYNFTVYRELIENPWRILYKTDEDTVYIMAVLDGRRNIEDLLLKRIMKKEI